MSTISAGTTTPTALSLSGDTTGALTFQVNGTTTAATLSAAGNFSLATGNLTFSSTAQRITGDMSNATIANRLAFQTSTTNGTTTVTAIPNGTQNIAAFSAESDSAATNSSTIQIAIRPTTGDAAVIAGIRGTGTYLPMTFATGGGERMRLDTSGNLSVGTASPQRRLHSYDAVSDNCILAQSGAGNAYIGFADVGTTSQTGLSVRMGSSGNGMIFQTGGTTTRMTIDSSGNVGIGTASPTTKLTVSSATNAGISVTDGTVTTILYNTSSANGTVGTTSNHPMAFYTNNTERMRVTAGGLVGIGTTSPNVGLEVASAATENNRSLRVAFDSTYYYEIRNLGAAGNRLRSNNGEMLFNITGTDYARLTTAGEFITGGTTDQGAYNLQCNGTGVWGAGAYVNGSDERLKDNIQSLDSGLDVIKAMRPVTFQYKPEYSKDQSVQPGFIAQELQTAMAGKAYLEGVVQEGPNHLNVAYQNIIPILVKAMQEQQDQIKVLQDKIAALEIR